MNRIALFPGSFDPFTSGHLNILTRALTIFDEVIVAVGINQDKRGFFSMEQREDIIRQATRGMEGVRIIHYEGLTIDICREDIINPLNDPRKNIIRQISGHYSYIVGFMSGT